VNGDDEIQLDLFNKAIHKVTDDPVRICYEYLAFLTTGPWSLEQLNKGYEAIRKVFRKQVSLQPSH
jgi:hypothetical protein